MAIGDKIFIADKPTLDDMNNKIGATTNADGTTTTGGVFAKLNAILQQFLSNWTVARAMKIDTIDTKIGTTADATTNTSLFGKINKVLNQQMVIRRVQRGVASIDNTTNPVNISLSGFSNINKMIVLLNGHFFSDGYGEAILESLTQGTLTFNASRKDITKSKVCSVSYQVIEFY